MASFRDRFFTPKVAKAIMSPLGIVLAGAGAAAGIVVGLPIAAAAGVGVLAWGGRVLAAVPGGAAVGEGRPVEAERAVAHVRRAGRGRQEALRPVVATVPVGPAPRAAAAALRPARRGHRRVVADRPPWPRAASARSARSTRPRPQHELAELRGRIGDRKPSPSEAETIEALEAQLASAGRLVALADRSRDRLRLLDARFDELVARTVEVSVGSGDTDVLGNDVDGLVSELESLRIAMEETDRAAHPRLPCRPTSAS